MENSLTIDKFSKSYGKLRAVDELSLTIHPGEAVAFIGPNGAGKSTTMRAIAGLLLPDAGRIAIAGHDIQEDPVHARENLGYVPQDLELYPYLTGPELLQFVARIRNISQNVADERIEELLEICDLKNASGKLIREYSGGMARKMAMAAALLPQPSLTVLDESFVGLDPESTFKLQKYLMRYTKNGGSLLISSHILPLLQTLCSRFFIIHHGKCVADLTSAELDKKLDDPAHDTLTALYLHLTDQAHLIQEMS